MRALTALELFWTLDYGSLSNIKLRISHNLMYMSPYQHVRMHMHAVHVHAVHAKAEHAGCIFCTAPCLQVKSGTVIATYLHGNVHAHVEVTGSASMA